VDKIAIQILWFAVACFGFTAYQVNLWALWRRRAESPATFWWGVGLCALGAIASAVVIFVFILVRDSMNAVQS
jgi:hypothetical protein